MIYLLYSLCLLTFNFYCVSSLFCLDHINPLDFSQTVVVECSLPSRKRSIHRNGSVSADFKNVLKFPAADIKAMPVLPQPDGKAESMIHVELSCYDGNDTLCINVKSALHRAASDISQVIELSHPLTVNVTLHSFCSRLGICNTKSNLMTSLGSAAPARTFPLEDEDGIVRFFPQALVKQLNLTSGLLYSPHDIHAMFNSDSQFSFDNTITSDQSDFHYVALHELIHGLGFTSAWIDYLSANNPVSITPHLLFLYPNPSKSNVHFAGFIENAFDRFIHTPSGTLSQKGAQMNKEFNSTTDFADDDALLQQLQSSHAWKIGKDTLAEASTPNTFKFDDKIVLETSIEFRAGSSVSHFSADLYSSTQDFLMRHIQHRGSTLEECIKQNGDPVYGAFGPGLRTVLGNLGYRIRGGIPTRVPSKDDSLLNSSKLTQHTKSAAQVGAKFSTLLLLFLHSVAFLISLHNHSL